MVSCISNTFNRLFFPSNIPENGGIGTKCAETTTRKKCAKIPRSNISGMCGMSGISGMPRSNFRNVWNVKTKKWETGNR